MSTYADEAEMLLVQLSELPGEWTIWLPESVSAMGLSYSQS